MQKNKFNFEEIKENIYYPWEDYMDECDISSLIGMTFVDYEISDDKKFVVFKNSANEIYLFFHCQDCYEDVYLEDVTGNLDDLLNTPILLAEESSDRKYDEEHDSVTWTYYKFATIKGYVDMRWCGTSNGYYSERVDLGKLKQKD